MSDTIVETPDGQRYRIEIKASGEVRDATGNLLETVTGESVQEVTEAEAQALRAVIEGNAS